MTAPHTPRQPRRVPLWMWAVIILAAAPGLGYPAMLSAISAPTATPMVRGLMWLYPAYVLISAFLAWQCYGRRTVLAWIIIVLLLLSHACIYYLSTVTI